MSQCGDYEDIIFNVINVFYGIVIADYFLPFKKKSPCIYRVKRTSVYIQDKGGSATPTQTPDKLPNRPSKSVEIVSSDLTLISNTMLHCND